MRKRMSFQQQHFAYCFMWDMPRLLKGMDL